MSYSSYASLQQVIASISRVELTLALLIRNTQSGIADPAARRVLLDFADFIESEHTKAATAPGNNP